MRSALLAIVLIPILVACESKAPVPPVVIFAVGDEDAVLAALLDEFTDEFGIPVNVIYGDSRENTDAVIANKVSPPADVLLSNNIADIWRAADDGALRPIRRESMASIPESLRDPDGLWAAIEVRYAAIRRAPDSALSRVSSYAALANPKLRGQLCLSSSKLAVNRSLIAMLIQDVGVKPAERIVRGWVRNLARSPFSTEEELRVAIESGSCNYGILSATPETETSENGGDRMYYVDIDGIGVARHAHNPQSAQILVNWMLQKKTLKDLSWSNGKNVGIAGWRDEDARLLAERSGYD